jgi:heat shock protein beta
MRIDRLAIHALALLAFSHAPLPFQQASLVLAEEEAGEAKILVEDTYQPPENAEHFKFEAEVSRMLDIVVNSLYQNKDVFLRELISNASDALDKIRFLALTKPEYLEAEEKLQVQIEFDAEANTLTVRDTGLGMTHDDMISNLGTVARSGTTRFLQALKDGGGETASGDISQIGQFGVGFYSAFLVADRVEVASKHPDSPVQYVWASKNGASEFTIFPDPRGATLTRGTEVTLFLKEDAMEYADEMRLQTLAMHYSEFVVHPIFLRFEETVEVEIEDDEPEETGDDEEKSEEGEDDLEVSDEDEPEEKAEKPKRTELVTTFDWSRLNKSPAIWTRSKEDIEDEEYQAFYKIISKEDDGMDAETWTHFQAEGNINFKSIIYLPSDVPPSWKAGGLEQAVTGLSLYVQKVLISDEFELLPRYLSFMKGVVDSDDLPLNVNRETLQESKIIQVIKKKVIRKALEMIRNLVRSSDEEVSKEMEEELDEDGEPKVIKNKYNEWFAKFAPSLKMGAIEDEPNRDKLMKLLRYQSTSTKGDEWISFEQYIERMKDWQDEIYFVAGINLETVKKSQFLESFLQKGVEVLYFTDPIDEYLSQHVKKFGSKTLKNIASENVKFKDEEDEDMVSRRTKYYKDTFKPLTKWLKKLYGASVMRVAVSNRLVSTPAIASSAEYGHSANMERIMRAQAHSHGQHDISMQSLKVFEINPRHPLIVKLLEGCPPDDDDGDFKVDSQIKDAAWILHEMALLNGGFPLSDPEAHTKRMMRFMKSQLDVESFDLLPEADVPLEEEKAPEDEEDFEFEFEEAKASDGDAKEAEAEETAEASDGPKGSSPEDAIPLTPDANGNLKVEL